MKKKRYRGGAESIPMLVVVLSAACMVLLLALFFGAAVSRSKAPAGNVPSDGKKGTDAVGTESADGKETPSEQTYAVEPPQTVPDVSQQSMDTEEPKPAETGAPASVVTEAPKPVETEAPKPAVTEAPKQEPKIPDSIPTVYDEKLLSSAALPEGTAPEDYIDRLIFFGDSTTYGMKPYKVFGTRDTKQVWTPTSGTLALFRATTDLIYDPNTDTELSLADICAAEKPEYLVMTLGVNGIAFMDETYFKTEYQNVINTILKASPDTKLILQSMYPVARSYENQTSINNEKIQAGNQWIVEIAAAYGLPYLNTYSALVGADGYLPENYQNGDGMHFNEVSFAVVIDYVRSHPYLK